MNKDHAEIVLRNRKHYSAPTVERAEQFLALLNPRSVDERTVAERKWRAPTKAHAEQKPCDHGLFSDDSKQRELF